LRERIKASNACSDKHIVEKKTSKRETPKQTEFREFFSVSRPDSSKLQASASPGITIQIRLKNPDFPHSTRLLTRKNTEFWLSATQDGQV
jgi:hypothetical protein